MWTAIIVEFYKFGGAGSKLCDLQYCFLLSKKCCQAFCAQKKDNDLKFKI